MTSPYSSSNLSGAPWSATYSPHASRDTSSAVEAEENASGKNSKVCVKQVVTRTVTYCRTPLDPAPKGKRRKVEETHSSSASSASDGEKEDKDHKGNNEDGTSEETSQRPTELKEEPIEEP